MSIEFLETDFEKASYLAAVLTARATNGDASDSDYQTLRHDLLSKSEIANYLPKWLKLHRTLDSFWGFIQPKLKSYAERRTFIAEEFDQVLTLLEFGHTAAMQAKTETVESIPLSDSPQSFVSEKKKKVFIVHGRDNAAKLEVARHVESLSIGTIILHEQASSGRTIIEKIEHYSEEADFAIVLYTACDHGRGIHETKTPPRNRARQNVVFEHGYLMAQLGRENVCALVKGEIETPNDISGVVYVDLDEKGAWKMELNKELKACGYKISE